MKIKVDFVTNSSSVSVVLLGVSLTRSDLQKNEVILERVYKSFLDSLTDEEKEKFKDKTAEQALEDSNDFYDCFWDFIENILVEDGLDFEYNRDWDQVWVGRSPFSINDNETGGQFKQRTCCSLRKVGIKVSPDKLEKITKSWFNG